VAPQADYSAGDVVLAKYGATNSFFWAKVTRVYRARGSMVCDLSWLRPQAGTPGGKLYACSAGHDETDHGEGLLLQLLRRPGPAELGAAAPPGAGGSARVAVDLADMLGEAVQQKAAVQSQSLDSVLASIMAKGEESRAAAPVTGKWDALFPGSNMPSQGYAIPVVPPTPWPSHPPPVPAVPAPNWHMAKLAEPSKIRPEAHVGKKREGSFDFVSDLMSVELHGKE